MPATPRRGSHVAQPPPRRCRCAEPPGAIAAGKTAPRRPPPPSAAVGLRRGGGHLPLHPSLPSRTAGQVPARTPPTSPSGAVAARGAGSRRPARGGSGPVTHLELRSPQPAGGGPCRWKQARPSPLPLCAQPPPEPLRPVPQRARRRRPGGSTLRAGPGRAGGLRAAPGKWRPGEGAEPAHRSRVLGSRGDGLEGRGVSAGPGV